LRIQVISNSE